ncbi:DUF2155 domain-containing protein [Parvularcula lutaonensis]|uniref:DUF2155 domain-containing protein n=1 Tax=Parvularcula lutaonensis TaxID=491923 RepID=A0ABV7M7G4_9PROT|nr:DUF2155 domain-containing protein [Parvularcula lutaonensis]GGY41928.1 hypothetical protein GCM10007148_08190 [Parvularcula lutaonensis]
MLISILALAAQLQAQEPEYLLGWTVEPPAPVEGQETELDRLSRSKSGAGFLDSVFGTDSDDSRIPVSVTLRALDKVTASFVDLEVPIGLPQAFGSLTLLPRTCSTRPPEEFPETTVFLEVYSGDTDAAGKRARDTSDVANGAGTPDGQADPIAALIEDSDAQVPPSIQAQIDTELFGEPVFKGWMFASSPSLNAMEHPTYDVWVIACKMEDPEI